MRKMRSSPALSALLIATCAVLAPAQGGPGPAPGIPPLPPPPVPAANPITPAKAVLGKILFWDEQLSSDNTVACGTCHRPGAGGSDPRLGLHPGNDGIANTPDDKTASPGVIRSDANNEYTPDATFGLVRQVTGRSAPTMINAAYAPLLFWDGRADGSFEDPSTGAVVIPVGGALESQAVGPPLSDAEMAHENRDWNQVAAKIANVAPLKLATNLTPDIQAALAVNPDYPGLFQAAFGSPVVNPSRIAMAIATYQRTLISNQTPWDDFNAGNPTALTPNQQQGLQVFTGPGRCNVCHGTAQFTNHSFRNIGLRPVAEDSGRFAITGNPGDQGRFKSPTLRNVALKPTFMHNGQFTTLNQVVNFYNGNGDFPFNIDPVMAQINMSPLQRQQLVDFLTNGLTDPRVALGLPPFDRPTLKSELGPPNQLLPPGTAGSGGVIPRMIASVPGNVGNPDFKLGLRDALGATTAFFALSTAAAPPGTDFMGIPLHVDLNAGLSVTPVFTNGAGAGNGYATMKFPIPNNPALIGFQGVAQWFVFDAGSPTLGYSASAGTVVTLF